MLAIPCSLDPPLTVRFQPGSDVDAGRRLAREFAAAIAQPSLERLEALRVTTVGLAAHMRSAIGQPETAVVALKAMLRGAGGEGWSPSLATTPDEDERRTAMLVYQELFRWWVAAYFRDDAFPS